MGVNKFHLSLATISNGMILSCYNKEETQFELLDPPKGKGYNKVIDSKPGDSVYLEGSEPRKEKLATLSDNKFKKVKLLFRSDDDCVCNFNDQKLRTEGGFITVKSLKNSVIS